MIKSMEKVYTVDEIKFVLKDVLNDKPVEKVILFGSYAKNEANKLSDIDLLIDTNGELRGLAFLKLVCQIEESFGKEVDCFEKYEIIPNSKVDLEIKNTGVIVYER